jgi:glucose-6-phosphate 1-dehydrogenase
MRDDVVLGQYLGYRDEPGVAAQSTVETFAALRLFLDSWRWQDVPFYLRTGKRLAVSATEVLVTLRRPPQRWFSGRDLGGEQPNHLRFRVGPEFEIALGATVLASGRPRKSTQVELFACRHPDEQVEPYELLLGAALEGDPLPFARQDEVEAAWRVVDPILAGHDRPATYAPGSWGPAQADRLLDSGAEWHDPRAG